MMWNCPKLVRYWGDVLSLIGSVYQVTVEETPLTCILGYVEDVATDPMEQLAIARLLYMARKVIAYHWLDSDPPVLQEFIGKVNWLLLLERGIYLKRGAIRKFDSVWAKWMDSPGLASSTLLRNRPTPSIVRSPHERL